MPIDLRCLGRNNPHERDLYLRGVAQRIGGGGGGGRNVSDNHSSNTAATTTTETTTQQQQQHNNPASLLDEALARHEAVSRLHKERDAVYKSQRQQQQQQLRNSKGQTTIHKKNEDSNNNNNSSTTDHLLLKNDELREQLETAQASLQHTLWKLPNWVDLDLHFHQEHAVADDDDEDGARRTVSTTGTHNTIIRCSTSSASGRVMMIHKADDARTSNQDHHQPELAVSVPKDPLFCARCYEELGAAAPTTTIATACLVGHGILLATAVHRFFVNALMSDNEFFAQNDAAATAHHWHLPSSGLGSVSASRYHDLWGCCCYSSSGGALLSSLANHNCCAVCNTCNTNSSNTAAAAAPATILPNTLQQPQTVALPSWLTLLLHHQSGTYWDRQLPKLTLLSCTTTPANTTVAANGNAPAPGDNSSSCDGREVARVGSWTTGGRRRDKKKKSAALLWHQRLAVQEQLQILAVTGPSLEADSRPLQRRIMERVRDLFEQLLKNDSDDEDDDDNNDNNDSSSTAAAVRIRAVPAAELLPMESSRLVVQGFLPPLFEKPVCLAYLSNLQDYCTGSELRHGTTKEALHVLHGMICSAAETMEWMCQNRATPLSISVPRVLACALERIVYTRTVVVSHKNGKRLVRDIVVAAGDSHDDTNDVTNKPEAPPEETQSGAQQLTNLSVTRIRAEALSSPFGFLPFYYR